MTFDSLLSLWAYACRDKYTEDADNLPPRQWADGLMHEKRAGTWYVVGNKPVVTGRHKDSKNRSKNSINLNQQVKRNKIVIDDNVFINRTYKNPAIEKIVKGINPKFEKGGFRYKNNCTRCCTTYEAIKRGLKVTAKGTSAKNENEIINDSLCQYEGNGFSLMYKNPDVKKAKGNGKDEILNQMKNWGDGARCSIIICLKDKRIHNFMAEQINGKTVFINPQDSNNMFYNENIFNYAISNSVKYFRTDNLEFDMMANICYEEIK